MTEIKRKRGGQLIGEKPMSSAERSRRHREQKRAEGTVSPRGYFVIEGSFIERLDAIVEFYGWASRSECLRDLLSGPLSLFADILERSKSCIQQIEDPNERARHIAETKKEMSSYVELFEGIKKSRQQQS